MFELYMIFHGQFLPVKDEYVDRLFGDFSRDFDNDDDYVTGDYDEAMLVSKLIKDVCSPLHHFEGVVMYLSDENYDDQLF